MLHRLDSATCFQKETSLPRQFLCSPSLRASSPGALWRLFFYWGTDHQGHSKAQQFIIKNAEETFDDFSYTVMQIMTKQIAFLRLQKLCL